MESSGKGDGGKNPNPVFSIPPKNRLKLQAFFTLQGNIAKAQCVECGNDLPERAYWIGHMGPLCYRCYLKADKK